MIDDLQKEYFDNLYDALRPFVGESVTARLKYQMVHRICRVQEEFLARHPEVVLQEAPGVKLLEDYFGHLSVEASPIVSKDN